MATPSNDIHSEAFRKAALQSECTRILVLLLVIAAVLAVVVTRALITRVPEQFETLPRTVGLILVATAYEGMMFVYVRWAVRRDRDLPTLAWLVNIGVETLFPTVAIIILTSSAFIGPYRALTAPAAHAYYFFIVLAALRLRPVLCFVTGLATALSFIALTAYTFRTYPAGASADGGAYPLQIYVTYGLFFLISSSAAAVLTARFREYVFAALREAETRRRFEELEREIAERRRAEEALVRLQARLIRSEKLASLGLLSAGVAHEINNPLAYVSNNLALIERDIAGLKAAAAACQGAAANIEPARGDFARKLEQLREDVELLFEQQDIERIISSTRQGVRRVADVVQKLRNFARLDRAELDRVDLNDAISSSLEMLRGRLSQSQITVEPHLGELPLVSCAPAQLNQVFLNLLINAIQAIEATSRGSGRIEIRTGAAGPVVVIEIADDGCGIPAAVLPRIFDPFFTTKPVGAASGLGLSISHGIVADHGGQIEVESTPGQGARFRVILPVDGKGAGNG